MEVLDCIECNASSILDGVQESIEDIKSEIEEWGMSQCLVQSINTQMVICWTVIQLLEGSASYLLERAMEIRDELSRMK